jgi:hypothetical protein
MRIRRTMIVVLVASIAVPAVAGPAFAGGRPDPPPSWLGPAIVASLIPIGAFFVSVIAIGIAQRRRRR